MTLLRTELLTSALPVLPASRAQGVDRRHCSSQARAPAPPAISILFVWCCEWMDDRIDKRRSPVMYPEALMSRRFGLRRMVLNFRRSLQSVK